jgi:hypothetical protein
MESTGPPTVAAFNRSQAFDSTRLLLGVPHCGNKGFAAAAIPLQSGAPLVPGGTTAAEALFLMRMIMLPCLPVYGPLLKFLTLNKKQYTIMAERFEQFS